jgi:hypothetical protein
MPSNRNTHYVEARDECLEEIPVIRERLKVTDTRIRRADAAIRRSLDEAWVTLRHVQAGS